MVEYSTADCRKLHMSLLMPIMKYVAIIQFSGIIISAFKILQIKVHSV